MAVTKVERVQVFETTDYDMFGLKKCNRIVDEKHVEKLKKRIEHNNLMHINPILVDENMEIVDGQHRFWALVQLGLPIIYQIVEDYKDEMLIELNCSQKNWKAQDYIKYYAEHCIKDFVLFKQTLEDTGFTPYQVAKITKTDLRDVKKGKIVYTREEQKQVRYFMERWTYFVNYPFCRTDAFIKALIEITNKRNFTWLRLIKQIEEHPEILKKQWDKGSYLHNLANLHNFGLSRNKWVCP